MVIHRKSSKEYSCIYVSKNHSKFKICKLKKCFVQDTIIWNYQSCIFSLNIDVQWLHYFLPRMFKNWFMLSVRISSYGCARVVLNFPYISLYFFPRTIFSSSSRLVRSTDKCMESSKHDWTLSCTATSLHFFFLKVLFLVPKVSNS